MSISNVTGGHSVFPSYSSSIPNKKLSQKEAFALLEAKLKTVNMNDIHQFNAYLNYASQLNSLILDEADDAD